MEMISSGLIVLLTYCSLRVKILSDNLVIVGLALNTPLKKRTEKITEQSQAERSSSQMKGGWGDKKKISIAFNSIR